MAAALTSDDISRLYEANASAFLAFFARRTFDPEASVDLLGETFAVAFRDRAKCRADTDAGRAAWLYGIAQHRLIDFYRRGQVQLRSMQRLGVVRRALDDDEYERIEDLAFAGEFAAAVRLAVQGLGTEERLALQLRVVEERPYAEVARRLGVTQDAARTRVSRALSSLRKSPALAEIMEVHGAGSGI